MDYKMNNHTLDIKTAFENNDDVALVILRNRNLLNSHTKKWLSRYFDRLEQPEKYDNNARAKKGYVECYNNKNGSPQYAAVLDQDYKDVNVMRWFQYNEKIHEKWGIKLNVLDAGAVDGAFKNVKIPSYFNSEVKKLKNQLKNESFSPKRKPLEDKNVDDDFDDEFDILEDFRDDFFRFTKSKPTCQM